MAKLADHVSGPQTGAVRHLLLRTGHSAVAGEKFPNRKRIAARTRSSRPRRTHRSPMTNLLRPFLTPRFCQLCQCLRLRSKAAFTRPNDGRAPAIDAEFFVDR